MSLNSLSSIWVGCQKNIIIYHKNYFILIIYVLSIFYLSFYIYAMLFYPSFYLEANLYRLHQGAYLPSCFQLDLTNEDRSIQRKKSRGTACGRALQKQRRGCFQGTTNNWILLDYQTCVEKMIWDSTQGQVTEDQLCHHKVLHFVLRATRNHWQNWTTEAVIQAVLQWKKLPWREGRASKEQEDTVS